MEDEEFERLVLAGIDALPDKIKTLMHNVAVVIDDEPSFEVRQKQGLGERDTLFGFYEGIPLTERGVDYGALPDKITIFKKPILATYSDPEDIKACVENTVWHEVAHHFGYDDPWIEKEEERRGKTR